MNFFSRLYAAGVMIVVAALMLAVEAIAFKPDSGCVVCHGDRQRMRALGAESMYLDPAQVDHDLNMGGRPSCSDCHLGDPGTLDKERAHAGMHTQILKGEQRPPNPRHIGDLRWHDRSRLKFAFRSSAGNRVCVKCHPEAAALPAQVPRTD
jgi:hypothetical protein